jgi:DNA-binding NarL/FixJ family response regulator
LLSDSVTEPFAILPLGGKTPEGELGGGVGEIDAFRGIVHEPVAVTLRGIVGRDEELAAVATFLDGVLPAALVLAGEAGIGKTTVWRAGLERAREQGVRVLACRPAESEARLSFAGLSDLVQPVLDEVLGALPPVQRRALEAALLLSEEERAPPDHRTISTACLGVLRWLARDGRVLVAVDDVQWLDPPTALVLEFVARRLAEEPVGLLVAERVAGDAEAPLGLGRSDLEVGRVRLGPLSTGALHRVLRDRFGVTLTRPVLRRVHEASGGNPFYALELVRALQARGGRIQPGRPLPVPETLEAILRERFEALPVRAREILAAAAALARPTESILGDPLALEQAAESGVIELADGEIRFSHPLLASAAYMSIPAVERRRLHRRLAELVTDPEERARHLALGATEPSEEVAHALDEAAREAAARGAPATAAELAELAVRLTPATDPDRLVERSVQAAGYHLPAGDLAKSAAILGRLADELPPGGARADALLLLASAQQSFERSLELATSALVDAHDDNARIAKIECYIAELNSVRGAPQQALAHARAALASAERAGDESVLAIALSTVAWFEMMSAVEPTPGLLERAVSLEDERLQAEASDSTSPSFALGMRLMCAGRLDEARARMDMSHYRAVSLGDQGALSAALLHLAELECRAGNWRIAARHAAEGYECAEQLGRKQDMSALLYVSALVDAHLGRVDEARSSAERGIALSESCGDEVFRLQNLAVLGFLELSLGDAAAADRILRPLAARLAASGWREPSISGELPNAIEALVELDELEEARRLLDDLQDRVDRIESPWAEASARRCEGLILAAQGDLEAAIAAFARALHVHESLPQPFDLGRTLLAQGVAQRRARRRRAARQTLDRALAVFDELGAALWAEKARAELGRVGGRTPSGGDLTPTERQVAELVAEGRSNKEVAAALVVSPKTIDGHLSKIYAKLGVHSRMQLTHRLGPERPR